MKPIKYDNATVEAPPSRCSYCGVIRDTKEITYVNYYKHYLYYQLIYQKKHYKLYGFLLIQKLL